MKVLQERNLDLFPTFVKVVDHEVDASLNRAIVATARSRPEFNDSGSNKNLLAQNLPWVEILKKRFDAALSVYMRELDPRRRSPWEVDAYMFFNYTEHGQFAPPHNHIGAADVVGIYYARAPRVTENTAAQSYYKLPGGMLLIHDPRVDASFDRRRPETAEFFLIAPRAGRMVIHPAALLHSVTPMRTSRSRVAVVCDFILDKSTRRANYQTYSLDTSSASP